MPQTAPATRRATVLGLLGCLGAGALVCTTPEPDYLACSEAAPCPTDRACVYGLCVPRCAGGEPCVEGAVCQDDGACVNACDEQHPCTQAYTCEEGSCVDDPCGHPEYWRHRLESDGAPVMIHYRDAVELAEAQRTLAAIERAWRIETTVLGFDPPRLDGGRCGPDGRFDVFVWRSYRGGAADVIAEDPATAWDDRIGYLIVDPWGPYGGAVLAATVAHELNHAAQAAYDWYEAPILFEMTAVFVEDVVYDDTNAWIGYLGDYQGHPEWSFDHDDGYATDYFYGSALYLFYLREAVFGGDASFVSEVWRRARNPPGVNEPDMADAFESVLQERGRSYEETLLGFARWRAAPRDLDGSGDFEEGPLLPEEARVPIVASLRAGDPALTSTVMLLGSRYLSVGRAEPGQNSLRVRLDGDPGVRWALQTTAGLRGDEDGAPLESRGGAATLELGELDQRTLVVTALPRDPAGFDPDTRTADSFAFRLSVEPAE